MSLRKCLDLGAKVKLYKMKIKLNQDAIYYKCVFLGIVPVLLLLVMGYKDILSAFAIYIIVGLPIILVMKIVFSTWILGEKHFLIIEKNKIIVYHGYRFDDIKEMKYDIFDAKVIYNNIPCLEALTFESTHPIILYKYMFSSKDYKKLIDYITELP